MTQNKSMQIERDGVEVGSYNIKENGVGTFNIYPEHPELIKDLMNGKPTKLPDGESVSSKPFSKSKTKSSGIYDYLGNELSVGDVVYYAVTRRYGARSILLRGIITKFTPSGSVRVGDSLINRPDEQIAKA